MLVPPVVLVCTDAAVPAHDVAAKERTRSANVSEQRVSLAATAAGLMLTNMNVFELPPSESESNCGAARKHVST